VQNYTYHWEVKDLLTQFLQAFDGAIVKRYDNSRNAGNNVAVRYVYAPKERVLHDLVNKAQHFTLPAVAFWISSISRDPTRVFNKLEGQFLVNKLAGAYDSATAASNLQPVPVNIEVTVSILTKFQEDMDQILSNFVPYNDPYFIISWQRDGMAGIEIRSEVLWSGSLAMTYPTEQSPDKTFRVSCDTGFTIKGWLFKADANPVGRIFKVDSNFYAVSGTPTLENVDYLTNPEYTENFTLSAIPTIPFVDRWLAPISLSGAINMYGTELNYTNNVYLSANNRMFGTTTTFNPFSASHSLSASYPALTGVVPALTYYINSSNMLQVIYPAPSALGNFDIIVANEAGYTFLTKSAYNATYTTQFPYVSGIQVIT